MPKHKRLWTFQRILPACEQGDAEAWRAFLESYNPLAFRYLEHYLPPAASRRAEAWSAALRELSDEQCARLKTFDHQAEREFLVDLRDFLLERGAPSLDASADASDAPRPTVESLKALLNGLPLAHQEVLFLKLAGYSDATIEGMMRATPTVAAAGLERLQADYGVLLRHERDACLWPSAWAEFLRETRSQRIEDCPQPRVFVRVHDGQTTWYEKDPAEQHVAGCLHCLERWAALREAGYWRRVIPPANAGEVAEFLSALPIQAAPPARKSLLQKLFG
jgi:hypothetical protein